MSFYFVNNSRFRPFNYDELVKPLVQYRDAYTAAEQDFSTLAAQTETWKDIATQTQNPYAYSLYKSYSDDLNSAISSFSKGMDITNRGQLLGLKRDYAKKIAPIQNAYNIRLKHMDEQTKGRAAGLVYATDAATTSLDEYINNPALQHQFADSNAGYRRVAQAASALSKKLSNVSVGRIDQYTKSFLQEHGYKDTEVNQAIRDIQGALQGDGNVRGTGILYDILETEMNTSGVSQWQDKARQADYLNRISPALYNAVGQTDIKPMEDYGARLAAREAIKGASGNVSTNKYYRSVPLTSVDASKKTSRMKDDADFLRAMLANPGALAEKGKRYRPAQISPSGAVVVEGRYEESNPNLERLTNIGKRYGIDINLSQIDRQGGTSVSTNIPEVISYLEDEINKSAMRSNSYVVDITDSSLIAKTIEENSKSFGRRSGESGIYELKNNKKGDSANIEEVTEYLAGNSKGFLEYDPSVGIIYTGTNNKGKTKSFVLDPEIVNSATIGEGGYRQNRYQAIMDDLNKMIELGDSDGQEFLIDRFMTELYQQFNTIPKKQGETLSSKEG